MPKISILTVTSRDLNMLEYQVAALAGQTFEDFEWIFVDDLYAQRQDKLKALVGDIFPLIHIPPDHIVNYFAPGAAMNDGLVHCRGTLVYFMADYILPHGDCLRRHWELHERFPKAMISGRCLEVDFMPSALEETGKKFTGAEYRMSLFTQGFFRMEKVEEHLFEGFRDGVQNFWTGRNDSAPLEALLACNGIDEQYDGRHGYHDDDMAQRLFTYGLRYLLDFQSSVLQFPHARCEKTTIKSEAEQQRLKEELIPQRVKLGIYRANPHRNLEGERRCLKV